MKIGVVIPTYNEEENIETALRELDKALKGLYEYKVIVVDDSSDRTAEIAKNYGAKVIKFPKRVGKGTAVITGIREALKYGVNAVVVNDADEQYPMKYVPEFVKKLENADAVFAYSPKRKGIFSRFMNAITGCDYNWAVGLKVFRKDLAEELVKARPWNYIKWNYDIYSTLLPYIKGKKVEKVEVEGKRLYGKSKFNSRKFEYILTFPVILKACRYSAKNSIQDWVRITFNFDEWYRANKNLPLKEIERKIERCEKISQILILGGLGGSSFLLYFYQVPNRDKLAHALKGYLTSGLVSFVYRLKAKNKKLGKFLGLVAAVLGSIAWEYKDSLIYGEVEALDIGGDIAGGSLSSLITSLYERKIDKINHKI